MGADKGVLCFFSLWGRSTCARLLARYQKRGTEQLLLPIVSPIAASMVAVWMSLRKAYLPLSAPTCRSARVMSLNSRSWVGANRPKPMAKSAGAVRTPAAMSGVSAFNCRNKAISENDLTHWMTRRTGARASRPPQPQAGCPRSREVG